MPPSLKVETENRMAILAANSRYAASRPKKLGKLGLPPSKSYLVVTCIDARIDPAEAFGIDLGEAHVIRNAGGSCVAALRDIIISTHFLGVKEVFIIKHKDCGMSFLNSQDKPILQQLYPDSIACPGASSIVDMAWYDFKDPHDAVRQDWWFVQNHPTIRAQDPNKPEREIIIHGFVYDPETGKLEEVQPRLPPSQNPIPGSQPNGDDPVDEGNKRQRKGAVTKRPERSTPKPPERSTPKPSTTTTDGKHLPRSSRDRPSTTNGIKRSGGVTKTKSVPKKKSDLMYGIP